MSAYVGERISLPVPLLDEARNINYCRFIHTIQGDEERIVKDARKAKLNVIVVNAVRELPTGFTIVLAKG